MRRATAVILVIGFCAACNLGIFSSDYCPLAPNGRCSSQGSEISYVWEQVMIHRGGVLVPGTLQTRVGATSNQRPAVRWTNQDTVSHHLVFMWMGMTRAKSRRPASRRSRSSRTGRSRTTASSILGWWEPWWCHERSPSWRVHPRPTVIPIAADPRTRQLEPTAVVVDPRDELTN